MLIFIIILVFCHKAIGDDEDAVIVTIKQGQLKGREFTNKLTKDKFYGFLDIPYAVPPVGDYRFKVFRNQS